MAPGRECCMNRAVCCCSETCPVHCLVPSRAAEPDPACSRDGSDQGGRAGGPGCGARPAPPLQLLVALLPEGEPSPACEARTRLGDSGGGGRHWGSRWGPRSPPVLHILIHSIFGTRKGTNISVRNSFLFPPPPGPPAGPAAAAQSSICGPHCHCRPTRGRGRSSWSGVGQGPGGRP